MLARLLGAGDYGLYVLAVSAATIFAGLAALGLDDAMTRYVAILFGRQDRMGVRGTIQVGVVVSTVMGVVLGAVMFVAAQPLADHLFDEPRLAEMLRLLAIIIPFLTLSNVLAGTARGFGRMDFVALAENVVMSVVRLVLLLIVVAAAQGGLTVTAAVIVFGISDVSATITLVALLQKYYPLTSVREGDARRVAPEVFRFAFSPLVVGDAAPVPSQLRDHPARRDRRGRERRHLRHRRQHHDGGTPLFARPVRRGETDSRPTARHRGPGRPHPLVRDRDPLGLHRHAALLPDHRAVPRTDPPRVRRLVHDRLDRAADPGVRRDRQRRDGRVRSGARHDRPHQGQALQRHNDDGAAHRRQRDLDPALRRDRCRGRCH